MGRVKSQPKAAQAAGRRKRAATASDRPTDVHSVSCRESARQQLAEDVAAFLESGGKITAVPRNHRADPPRRPENNYGRGSI